MFGEERKVDAVAQPGRAEWIRIAEPGFDWRHNGEAFLFTTPRRYATGEVEIHIGHRDLARDPASRFEITTAMKHLLHPAAAILLASSISGCATHVTMIGPARPPISPAAVRIYETPPRHYQQIAIINSSAGTTWLFPDRGSLDETIAELRSQAAALGANGVLLQAVYDQPVGGLSVGVGGFGGGHHNFYGGGGSVGGPLINRRVQAIAIYVHR